MAKKLALRTIQPSNAYLKQLWCDKVFLGSSRPLYFAPPKYHKTRSMVLWPSIPMTLIPESTQVYEVLY